MIRSSAWRRRSRCAASPARRRAPASSPPRARRRSAASRSSSDATGLARRMAPVRIGGRLAQARPDFWQEEDETRAGARRSDRSAKAMRWDQTRPVRQYRGSSRPGLRRRRRRARASAGGGGLGIGTIVILGVIAYALGINPALLIGGAEVFNKMRGGGQVAQQRARPADASGADRRAGGSPGAVHRRRARRATRRLVAMCCPSRRAFASRRRGSCCSTASPARPAAARNRRWGRSTARSTARSISTPPSSRTWTGASAAAAISPMPM